MSTFSLTWIVAGLTVTGVVLRPFAWPEAVWAILGATLLVVLGSLAPSAALEAVGRGTDVYLFLIGMMLLSEIARRERLFDWLAAFATSHARGSPRRLFVLIYGCGILVTAFLSNDATAVVLTPAVYAACKAAKVRDPMPYLLICAFIANAASFVLPISNPANLVVFGNGTMPSLLHWLSLFALPSLVAIVVTFAALWWTQRKALAEDTVSTIVEGVSLTRQARLAGLALCVTAVLLVAVSALGGDLGLTTFLAGAVTTALILIANREGPGEILRGISWTALLLVAGLFVVVEATEATGLHTLIGGWIVQGAAQSVYATAFASGAAAALFSNLANNLPVGLLAASALHTADMPQLVSAATMIGVDLGPNLSVTGSLATILWLTALRREGLHIGAWQFLKIGVVVATPAVILSLATLIIVGPLTSLQ